MTRIVGNHFEAQHLHRLGRSCQENEGIKGLKHAEMHSRRPGWSGARRDDARLHSQNMLTGYMRLPRSQDRAPSVVSLSSIVDIPTSFVRNYRNRQVFGALVVAPSALARRIFFANHLVDLLEFSEYNLQQFCRAYGKPTRAQYLG